MFDTESYLEWPPLECIPSALADRVHGSRAHLDAFYRYSQILDLRTWRDDLTEITRTKTFGQAAPIFRNGIIYRLGVASQWLAVQSTVDADSAAAIELWSQVVHSTAASSRLNVRSRYNIAVTWTNTYRTALDADLLHDAVEMLSSCVREAAPGSPEVALCWEGASLAYSQRYVRLGDPDDLDRAVAAAEFCVELMPAGSPRRVRYFARLASVCALRHRFTGEVEDLDRALSGYARVEAIVDVGSADWLTFLGDVSFLRRTRFGLTRDQHDLEQALEHDRTRLARVSPESTAYELSLQSYGISLEMLFTLSGDRRHIDASIDCHIRALRLRTNAHAHRAGHYTNLGIALMRRYLTFDDPADLNASIEAHRGALPTAYEADQSAQIVEKTSNLASVLILLDRVDPDESLAAEIIRLNDVATGGVLLAPSVALDSASVAARWARDRGRIKLAAEYYRRGLRTAQHLFDVQTLRRNRLLRAQEFRTLPAEAALVFSQLGLLTDAVLAIEHGRALTLSDELERKHVQLDRLGQDGHQDLVDAYVLRARSLAALSIEPLN